ncbi:Exocyst complex component 7, partial [Smittium culicis]
MKPKYTQENIDDEKEELEFMKESLLEMDQLSEQTARVLKVFDLRLKSLAKISAPIYKSTEKLARLYVNVGETAISLDNILKFYEASGHDSSIIISGIQQEDLDLYLSTIKRLHEAEQVLSKIKLLSAAQSQKDTEKLITAGHKNVQKYLISKTKKGSKKVDPTNFSFASDIPTINNHELNIIMSLFRKFERYEFHAKYTKDLAICFSEVRSSIAIECLSDLQSSSLDSYNLLNTDQSLNKSDFTAKKNPTTNFLIVEPSAQGQQMSSAQSIYRTYTENFLKVLVC